MKKTMLTLAVALCIMPLGANAQRVLSLEECRQLALENSNELKTARQKVEIAGYDKNIALSNYFPKVSASGAYMYTDQEVKLISDERAQFMQNAGTVLQNDVAQKVTTLMSDPDIIKKYMTDPAFQKMIAALQATDLATPINTIGQHITEALTLDMHNLCGAVVSVQQPVFMGGKIVASNKMAAYAQQLAESQCDQQQSQVIVDIEQAYWQIVSIAAKKQLAENYADLLQHMGSDVDALVEDGFATPADALTVKVKSNEAQMLLTKATNGLALAKMLLCKECGLPLDCDIMLEDEGLESVPAPALGEEMSDEQVYAARPEIRSLDLAKKIYDKKVAVTRADALPKVALTANYAVTNPSITNGFENKFGGFFSAGVVVNVPIFHGTELAQKTKKAKAEAALADIKMDDAKKMISLQVAQLRQQAVEAQEKLVTAQSNLDNAEENLRVATEGWQEGVIASSVVLQAQTAWLQAHSECIETGVELQMCSVKLAQAEGRL